MRVTCLRRNQEGKRELWGQLEGESRNGKEIASFVIGTIWGYPLGSLACDLHSLSQGNKRELSEYFHK